MDSRDCLPASRDCLPAEFELPVVAFVLVCEDRDSMLPRLACAELWPTT